MRNGNNKRTTTVIPIIMAVLTVPMRNGNIPKFQASPWYRLSSYRTYEEWKPGKPGAGKTLSAGSYRTYEEWKLDWKNWDFTFFYRVLTVPMRNGNIIGVDILLRLLVLFLPYL